MSLVAYDSSDESDEEKISKPPMINNLLESNAKRPRETVKITIPSLKEFENEEETPPANVSKKPKLQSGSGLFSLLPPPKNTSTLAKPGFMPHILKSKKEQPSSSKTSKQNLENSKITSAASVISEEQESDEEISSAIEKSTNTSERNDFFWLDDLAANDKSGEEKNKKNVSIFSSNDTFLKKLPTELTSSSVMEQSDHAESRDNAYLQPYQEMPETDPFEISYSGEGSVQQSYPLQNSSVDESVSGSQTTESLLKDKEFLRGRRREFENVDFIDVNLDDQLTDKNELLMRNLTEETTHRPSRKRHNMPTQQQKRKHQITYLAFQAKEREMDLKNQWALNSRTRRETQAKYGF